MEKRGKKNEVAIPVYFRNHRFLTPSERKLFKAIVEASPDHWVFPQVALSALVNHRKGIQIARDKIAQKYVDFAIFDQGFNVVLVIELDDPSHDAPDRQKADAEKNYALESAGIRVVRAKRTDVAPETIRKLIVLTHKQWETPTPRK